MPQEFSIGYRKSLIDLSFYKISRNSGISKLGYSLVNKESVCLNLKSENSDILHFNLFSIFLHESSLFLNPDDEFF
jgi:hypothetical protein